MIGLVGKGLTFDSGGYNLKVGGMIEMMKFDMGGAGAVLGAAQAIAGIKPEGVEVRKVRMLGGIFASPRAGIMLTRSTIRMRLNDAEMS